MYENEKKKYYSDISVLLFDFYNARQKSFSMKQKTSALRQVVQGLLNKNYKKLDLQLKQLKDTKKKDKYRIYGELLTVYGYNAEPKSTSLKVINYYDNKEITIPLDPCLSAIDNGKKYYEKYAKLKRTYEALTDIVKDTELEIEHLESVLTSLDTINDDADIAEIKNEMSNSGYLKSRYAFADKKMQRKNPAKQPAVKSKPLHFLSGDGFDIYVGKNNYQNDYITFKLAGPDDWWFHAKKIPGSHVIIKSNGEEIPDSTFNEAARLAAHFSKANFQSGPEYNGYVEVDYIQKKFLKKTVGGKPGFVIYHTNYSVNTTTDISGIRQVQ